MSAVSILAYGAALPRLRLPASEYRNAWGGCAASGPTQKAFCAYDEDPVTLAVAAARLACDRLGAGELAFDALYVGATTLPYEEKPSSASIVTALTGRRGVRVVELRGSPQAGLQALVAAAEFCKANPGRIALAIAADAPSAPPDMPYEHALGAAAAAFVLGSGPGVATLGADAACSLETFGSRFRRLGATGIADLELRTQEDADAVAALAGMEALPRGADVLACGLPPRAGAAAAKRLGAARADAVWPRLGDAGTASAAVALADALDGAAPGQRLLALAVGAGAIGVEVTATGGPEGRRAGPSVADLLGGGTPVDYVAYLRHRRVLSSRLGDTA